MPKLHLINMKIRESVLSIERLIFDSYRLWAVATHLRCPVLIFRNMMVILTANIMLDKVLQPKVI